MSQYELMQEIHELLIPVAEKIGKKIESSEFWYILPKNNPKNEWQLVHRDATNPNDYTDFAPAIQAPQIRQILVVCEEVLGENPDIAKWQKQADEVKPVYYRDEYVQYYQILGNIMMLPETKAQALCQRWLGNLKPMFDENPEQVLQEFVDVLKGILEK